MSHRFVLSVLAAALALGLVVLWRQHGNQDQLRGRLDQARKELTEKQRRIDRLESELARELQQQKGITDMVDQVLAEREKSKGERQRLAKERRKPMSGGLRFALVALNECLAQDGHEGMRFSRADKLEDKVLHAPQLVDRDVRALTTTHYLPSEMRVSLLRDKGVVQLRMLGGHIIRFGKREVLPSEGQVVVLRDVDGRLWERRLPYLVEATGLYPVDLGAAAPKPTRMDPVTKDAWLHRMDRLTREAGGPIRYRVDGFRNLENGVFWNVLLTGYDKKKRLAMSIEAKRMRVIVNDKASTTELAFFDGVVRRKAGEARLSDAGYRLLLTGVTPTTASDIMLGMTKRR